MSKVALACDDVPAAWAAAAVASRTRCESLSDERRRIPRSWGLLLVPLVPLPLPLLALAAVPLRLLLLPLRVPIRAVPDR